MLFITLHFPSSSTVTTFLLSENWPYHLHHLSVINLLSLSLILPNAKQSGRHPLLAEIKEKLKPLQLASAGPEFALLISPRSSSPGNKCIEKQLGLYMLGLCWTQKKAESGLAFLSLLLFISLLSFLLLNSVLPAYGFSPSQVIWLIPIHFPPPPPFEIAFPETEIPNRLTTDAVPARVTFFPFVSFPLSFLSAGVFFVFLLSCLVSHSFTYLPSKLFFSLLFPHLYFLASATYVLFLPWGISSRLFLHFPLSPCFTSSLPSAFRYFMQFYRHQTAALPADPGRSWSAQTTAVERSCMCPAADKQLPGRKGLPLPTQPIFACLSGTEAIVNGYRQAKP